MTASFILLLRHDFFEEHGGDLGHCNGKGLMSYGKNPPNKWSDCSNEDFKDWYKRAGYACFAKDTQKLSCGPDQPVKVLLANTMSVYI